MKHYSQNDEQEFILSFFGGRIGNLLDIGAYDGITFSNTRALLESGWQGILVEPDPFNIAKLIESCQSSAHVVCAAVSECFGLTDVSLESYPDRGWASTIDRNLMTPDRILQPRPVGVSVVAIEIGDLVALAKDLERWPFNFISIDAEGMDFLILKSTPTSVLEHCELLCIEPHNLEQRSEMKNYLEGVGFKIAHETPENLLVCQA